jgi:hypothetical protein
VLCGAGGSEDGIVRTEREGGREGGLITRYEVLCRVGCKQGIEQTTFESF